MSKNEVTAAEAENKQVARTVPRNTGPKTSKIGNIDSSDLIIPRVKLLQAISPEITEFNHPGAKAGQFWHTILNQPLGDKLRFVPIIIRKSIVLWSPRNDDRGILARSSDGVHWDKGFENLEFEVKPKGSPKPIKYFTDANVAASGLADFGSSIPGDPKSPPAASLTYSMMFFFPDFPEMSPAVVINTRSAVKRAKDLLSKIEMRQGDHYEQQYVMGTTDEKGDEGPYKGYSYTSDGYADDVTYERTKSLYDKFKEADWKANEETDEAVGGGGGGSSRVDTSDERAQAF